MFFSPWKYEKKRAQKLLIIHNWTFLGSSFRTAHIYRRKIVFPCWKLGWSTLCPFYFVAAALNILIPINLRFHVFNLCNIKVLWLFRKNVEVCTYLKVCRSMYLCMNVKIKFSFRNYSILGPWHSRPPKYEGNSTIDVN